MRYASPSILNENDFQFLRENQSNLSRDKNYINFVSWLKKQESTPVSNELDNLKKEANQKSQQLRNTLIELSYSTNEVIAILNVTRQAIMNRINAGKILGFKVNKNYFFPRWQFDEKQPSGIVDGLSKVLKSFSPSITDIEIVNWFERPLEGQTQKRSTLFSQSGGLELLIQDAKSIGGNSG